MAEAFKFLHASDLHLDSPLGELDHIPSHLRLAMINCPYDAAEKLFDIALSEKVDFVLLAGDVLDVESAGPRATTFLLNQFRRLADKGIHVYWASGAVDHPDRWPSSIQLPDNVVTFTSTIVEDVTHRRGDRPIATIFGAGHDPHRQEMADFSAIEGDVFPIALTYGELDPARTPVESIQYWAMGGRHQANRTEIGDAWVVHPGTIQGRHPGESGMCGACLIRVDSQSRIQMQRMETAAIRWHQQIVQVDEETAHDGLKNILAEQAIKLGSDFDGQVTLIEWLVETSGDFNPRLRNSQSVAELVQWLRDEFGQDTENCLWTTNLRIDAATELPSAWFEEDTILGEYLRSVGRYLSDPSLNLSIHEYLPEKSAGDTFAAMGRVAPELREMVLQQTALVGVEYLGAYKQSGSGDQTTTAID